MTAYELEVRKHRSSNKEERAATSGRWPAVGRRRGLAVGKKESAGGPNPDLTGRRPKGAPRERPRVYEKIKGETAIQKCWGGFFCGGVPNKQVDK